MKEYLFEKEIRLFGMRRSGNSAVRHFIVHSFSRGVVSVITNSYLSFRIDGPFSKNQRKYCEGVAKYFLTNVQHMSITDISVCLKPRYCYDWERKRWGKYYGKNGFAKDVYNLVIIRSPHNHLASVLKYPKDKMKYIYVGSRGHLEFTQLWIQYAEEVLGITNYIPKKIIVLFDKFVSDGYYRESISDSLGIPYIYSAMNNGSFDLKWDSPGSSFDWNEYVGMTQKMKVLDRWKYLINPGEKVWWTLDGCKKKLFHPKVVEYTKALFDIDLKGIFE
jgi:hypothetical protein